MRSSLPANRKGQPGVYLAADASLVQGHIPWAMVLAILESGTALTKLIFVNR